MFCANCGKKIGEEAQFCPACGARAEPVDGGRTEPAAPAAAATPQPAPVPQPTTPSGDEGVPGPSEAGALPPQTPPPSPPTGSPVAGAPPEQVAPVAETAPPPARRSYTCWIVGCLILVLLAIMGGVGIFLVSRYFYIKGTHVIQQLQSMEPDEGQTPSATEGGSPIDDIEPDQVHPPGDMGQAMRDLMDQMRQLGRGQEWQEALRNMAAAPPAMAAYQFVFTWRTGALEAIKPLVTPELAGDLQRLLPRGDLLQVGFDLERKTKLSDNAWEYVVVEQLMPRSGGEQTTERHRLRVTRSGNKWLVSEIERLN